MRIQITSVEGIIGRRILVNYRVRPEFIRPLLPPQFIVKQIDGWAMAGVCLIRLENERPRGLPASMGIRSENMAHRVAVEWTDNTGLHEGVFIFHRDTDSLINAFAGGRFFPGAHRRSRFSAWETDGLFKIEVASFQGETLTRVIARKQTNWPATSVFKSLDEASEFFRDGTCGWSVDHRGNLEGVQLHCSEWRVQALAVEHVEFAFFDDRNRFPRGAVQFDSALLMRGIRHEWRAMPSPFETREAA